MARSAQTLRPETCRIDIHGDGRIRRMDKAALALWKIEAPPDRVQELWVDGNATTIVPDSDPLLAKQGDGGEKAVAVKVVAQGDGLSLVVRDRSERLAELSLLQHREQQLEEAQQMAKVGSWSWDIPNDVVEWSDELYRLYGQEPGAFAATYDAFLAGVHPDDREWVDGRVKQAFQDHQPWKFTHRLQRPDGSVGWLTAQGAVSVRDGQPVRMYGTAQDITEIKELEESDRIRRAWFDKSIEMLCVTDSEGRFIELNPSWEKVLGWSTEEMLGQPFMEFVHPDDLDATNAEAAKLWELPEYQTLGFTNRYRAKDGNYRTLHWTSGADKSTGHLFAVARDVTEQERDRRRFEQLLESAPDAMVIVGDQGRIELANAQTEKLFGYTRSELLGEPIEKLIPTRFRGSHKGHRKEFMHKPRARPMGADLDLYARRKDGSEFPVEISLSPMESEDGTIVTAAIRDVTERKEGEKARRLAFEQNVAIEQLEKSNQARIQLLNTVAHELNTPLTPIQLQMRVLERNLDRKEAVPERTLGIIRRNLDRLAILVKDILDAARMDSGRLRLRPESIDLNQVVEEALESFEDLAAKQKVRLTVQSQGDTRVEADADRLTQVLFNLLSNAIKFTPEEGHVQVHVAGEDDRVVVSVEDDGEGFDAERAARLFQPFSQIHHGAGHGGTGLGLYICKGIIEEHGGHIRAVSPGEGLGASFRFWVPRGRPGPKGA